MSGAFVLRQLERLREAAAAGRLAAHLALLRADTSLSILLQLPAFAQVASEAFAGCKRVRLVRLAGFELREPYSRFPGRNRRHALGRMLPRGRARLRACTEQPIWRAPSMLRLNPGTELAVLRVTSTALHLWPPDVAPLGTAWRSL